MIFIGVLILGLLIFPQNAIASGKEAVEVCFFQVIPSLFPFFVLQNIATNSGVCQKISRKFGFVFYKIFKISNPLPFLLGIIGGYPLGAKSISTLVENKEISRNQASHMMTFCNNAGPAFIVGYVGICLFSSRNIGYIILFSHVFSTILIGMFFSLFAHEKYQKPRHKNVEEIPFYRLFINSVNLGFSSMLSVCGFIIFFTILVEILSCFNVFSSLSTVISCFLPFLSTNDISSILAGIFEMTTGLNQLNTSMSNIYTKLALASFMLGFAGFSIHFQTLNFCKDIPLKKYFTAKILHGLLSAFITVSIYKMLNPYISVAFMSTQTQKNLFLIYNAWFFWTFAVLITLFQKRKDK